MIITKKFAWFHIGKTGGDQFSKLMNLYYPEQILFQHDTKNNDKHLSIEQALLQYPEIKTLQLVCNIRKIASWLVSWNRYHFRAIYSRTNELIQKEIFDIVSSKSKAGLTIRQKFVQTHLSVEKVNQFPNEKLLELLSHVNSDENWMHVKHIDPVVHWLGGHKNIRFLRQENLLNDFYLLGAEYFGENPVIVSDSSKTNVNDVFPKIVLDKKDIDGIYADFPERKELERKVYGDDLA